MFAPQKGSAMSNRSTVLVLVAALASCFLLSVCVGLVGGGVYFLNPGNLPLANLALSTPEGLNRIAFVGNDFNIYIADPVSGDSTALTNDGGQEHAYNYPTWAPDSRRLAFVGYTFENGNPKEGALYTVAPSGEQLTPIYKTPQNIPFYLYWSPDSRLVSFLANKGSQTMALSVAHPDQADSGQEVDVGAPFYWAWAPDSSQMFTHVGGTRAQSEDARLGMVPFKDTTTKRSLESAPGQFQAPQWSGDGKILYSAQDGSGQVIAVSDALGNQISKLATYNGRASFAFSPDGTEVAYLLTPAQTRLPHFGPLRVVDVNGANPRVVSQDPVLAFLWSPDSTKLAYLTVTATQDQSNFNLDRLPPSITSTEPEHFSGALQSDQGGQGEIQLNWRLWDRATDTSRTMASFVPTLSFLEVIPYFDQYANSSTFWSPDSQSFVYTARETANSGAVFIADAIGTNPPRRIGDGVIAYWSWK